MKGEARKGLELTWRKPCRSSRRVHHSDIGAWRGAGGRRHTRTSWRLPSAVRHRHRLVCKEEPVYKGTGGHGQGPNSACVVKQLEMSSHFADIKKRYCSLLLHCCHLRNSRFLCSILTDRPRSAAPLTIWLSHSSAVPLICQSAAIHKASILHLAHMWSRSWPPETSVWPELYPSPPPLPLAASDWRLRCAAPPEPVCGRGCQIQIHHGRGETAGWERSGRSSGRPGSLLRDED